MDVFKAPPEVVTLQEMGGCDILYLPEMNRDDPYYNPLFMSQPQKDAYNRKGELRMIREVYMDHDVQTEGVREVRLKRQLAMAAMAGGYVAKSAVDSVLDWFGYHKDSGETVKHVNANMDHLKVVARHVEHMEVIVQKMVETAGHEEGQEK